MNKRKPTHLVYSTEAGRLCPQCHRPVLDCGCGKPRRPASGDGIVRLHRETKGRGGKAVTLITGIALPERDMRELTRALKQKCGVGGALKDDHIEIQGEQREKLKAELERRGFTVKIAGG